MLEYALAYAQRGWHIFPCKPRLKVPQTEHGVKDATNDPDTIRTWWTRWPDANIALACGTKSGVYVVDVDVDTDKGIDGFKALDEFPAMPVTALQESPRGGAHFLFKANKPPRNMNSFRTGIDIRGEGYYIILAPSVHPNGKLYAWSAGLSPDEVQLAEYPDSMQPPAKALPWSKPAIPANTTPILKNEKIDRAILYLAECEPAIQGQAGHDALLWAASSLVNGFLLDDATAKSLLWQHFNPRCVPPWNSGNAADVKDFERKVREARKTCTKAPGWLLTEYGMQNNDSQLLEYGQKLAEGLLKAKPVTPKQVITDETWPEWLYKPSGYVGDLVTWINATAGIAQPKLAVLCALTAAGALYGGKVRDISDQRTNLYSMGIAPSSAGKDHPFACVQKLFLAAGCDSLLGGGRVTSDSALETALVGNPVQLFGIDEAGDFFSNIRAGANSSGSQHLATIKPAMKELWSSAAKQFRGKQRADEEIRRINMPHVSLWALTTPGRFYEGVSTGDLEDGFLPRMVVAISSERPDYAFPESTTPPVSLVELTKAWAQRVVPPPDSLGNLAAATTRHSMLIQTQASAMSVFRAFSQKCKKELDKNERTSPLWGKGVENARRIALILAASDRFDNAEICEFHAQYAVALVQACIQDIALSISRNMAENAFEKDKQRIYRIILDRKDKGISKSELTRHTQWLRDPKTRDAYLVDLQSANLIVVGNKPTKTRPSTWIWQYPYGLTTGDIA
jgi:hypothetical protein